MKRSMLLLFALLLVALTAYAHEEDRTTMTLKPSSMKEGETKTFTDDGRTITVRREGDSLNVRIEGAGETKSVTITSAEEGDVVIRHGDGFMMSMPRAPRVRVHGTPLPPSPPRKLLKMDNWFVCPKDKTMLRVPEGKEEKEYKCPVDGTVMEKKKGHGFGFFFDDDEFEISL